MTYKIEDKGQGTHHLTIQVTPEDYRKDFQRQVQKMMSEGNFKGFRKGKVPYDFVTRMYGNSILSEAVSKSIDDAFSKAVAEEKINYVAQPLPVIEEPLSVNYRDLKKNYDYTLQIGVVPAFEVKGIGTDHTYTRYVVELDQSEVDNHLKYLSESLGTPESTGTTIEAKDTLELSAVELDGDTPKKDGWMTSFEVVMQSVSNDDLKSKLLTLKKGDKFDADINQLTRRSPESIRRDLLGIEDSDEREVGTHFTYTIEDVKRMKPVELTDELIKEKLPSWGMDSVDEIITDFKKNQTARFESDAKMLMYREMVDIISDHTEIPMPEPFLKEWLIKSEKATEEKANTILPSLTQEIKWEKIKSNLLAAYKVQITQEELDKRVEARAYQMVSQYGGAMGGMDYLMQYAVKMIQEDRNQMYNIASNLEVEKLFDAMSADIKIADHKISTQDFEAIIKAKYGKDEEANEDMEG